jgi:hypothetical protein
VQCLPRLAEAGHVIAVSAREVTEELGLWRTCDIDNRVLELSATSVARCPTVPKHQGGTTRSRCSCFLGLPFRWRHCAFHCARFGTGEKHIRATYKGIRDPLIGTSVLLLCWYLACTNIFIGTPDILARVSKLASSQSKS